MLLGALLQMEADLGMAVLAPAAAMAMLTAVVVVAILVERPVPMEIVHTGVVQKILVQTKIIPLVQDLAMDK